MCDGCKWREAVEQAEDILSSLDDLPDAAEDFADSVGEIVASMKQWMEDNGHVTDKMATALDNMQAGVQRWLDRDE